MGNVIEKGDFSTGFDNIAEVIDMYSLNPVAVRSDGCHEPSAVAQAITNFQPKMASKSCQITGWDTDWEDEDIPPKLTIGNLTLDLKKKNSSGTWTDALEGDVYIDKQGNITTS